MAEASVAKGGWAFWVPSHNNHPLVIRPKEETRRCEHRASGVHELGRLYRQVRRGNVDTLEGFRWARSWGSCGSVSAQRSDERPGTSYSGPRTEVPGLTSQEVSITG